MVSIFVRRASHAIASAKVMLRRVFHNQKKYPWEVKYTTIKKLDRGGNAQVVLVVDNEKNEFALKPLCPEYVKKSSDKRKRFLREVDVMRNELRDLSGVIPIIDFSEEGYWYVMPIAEKSMDVMKKKKMDLNQRIVAFQTIADTLRVIHSRGITHRDIKPANILYYKDHFCFCDFGLCRVKDSKLTEKRDNIGAKFTIAPEMRRDSKHSDPYKADVYSMGKTLWMFLTENEDAFDGTYSPIEEGIGLHFFKQYRDSNIADIEFLLEDATKNNPDDRPTIDEFCCRLSNWVNVSNSKDYASIQRSELRMIKHYLSLSCEVNSLTITNPKEIVKALNYFRLTPILNHMLYPRGGGLDFDSAEEVYETGCIALHSQLGIIDILKPKQFVFESLDDYNWFYFLLEADNLKPVLSSDDVISEELVEDIPGHYCNAIDYVYGVYDYDSGIKLPQSARRVERYCSGTFLILPKLGYYNQQPSTYDGRQNNCTAEEFKVYMQKLKKIADECEQKGYSFHQIVRLLDKIPNPFSRSDYDDRLVESEKIVFPPKTFILDAVRSIDVSNNLAKIKDKWSPATFAVYVTGEGLKCSDSLVYYYEDQVQWFLCNDGKIHQTTWGDKQVLKLHDRNEANSLIKEVDSAINDLYHEAGFENKGFQVAKCKMTVCRTGKPTHMFNKEEIKVLMRSADDRLGNTLVIDEFGFAQIIPGYFDTHTYPVSQETWCSRNNYVGKYSNLSDLERSYEWMLEGWLNYLKRDVAIYMDNSLEELNVSELLKEIKAYYN